ncbi:preprotein translocase subunit SecA [bacterium]|nr:preprotein translocase subunit SecA [bacterium]
MLLKLIERILGGSKHERDIKRLKPIVEEVNQFAESFQSLPDGELKNKTNEFKVRIQDRVGAIQEEIQRLQNQLTSIMIEDDVDVESVRQQIESLEQEENEQIEEVLQEILPEAFAVVKETCRRLVGKSWKVVGHEINWDMVPFDVQIMGGVVLHEGKIAEMATGEGKTLVATLPLYLNALSGKGAHLVTVNDYLAKRDCEWMGEIYKFLGLTVAYITNDMDPSTRQPAYNADITYGTNNEFGFDYLRDNMAVSLDRVVQRKHNYVIIDEVDSVLIDEARTPLIISGPVPEAKNRYAEMKPRVENLVRAQNMLIGQLVAEGERLQKEEKEYEAGIKWLQAFRGGPKNKRLVKIMRETGVQKLIHRVESDYMRDKILHELDEDLFFAIDEKAHTIDLTEKGRQKLSPDNPELFVLPDLATELSGIEGDESLPEHEKMRCREKIQSEYAEKSERLHNISQLLKAYSLFEKDVEYVVSEDGKVMIVDEFTGRLMPGRRFSDGLHQALEAKENVRIEHETQTWATITLQNFFRLYKKLAGMTGTAETEAGEFWEIYKLDVVVIPTNEPIRRFDDEDLVYRTKREKYNAIIDEIESLHQQNFPALVGTITVEVSETLSRMLKRRGIRHNVLNAKHHMQEAEIVARAGEPGMVTIATNMAGRGTDIKLGAGVIRIDEEGMQSLVKTVVDQCKSNHRVIVHEMPDLQMDTIAEAVRKHNFSVRVLRSHEEKQGLYRDLAGMKPGEATIISRNAGDHNDARVTFENLKHIKARDYTMGGLHIVGTERHEARRIDRQLRGRSGRQGDPGFSRFYLSLEDDLMRLFGSERIAGIMDRWGAEEGEVITHPMITKSIERAQKKVEMRNFDIRKHLLEYDDVMNKQREVIYNRRRRALIGENLRDENMAIIEDFVGDILQEYTTDGEYSEAWDWDGLSETYLNTVYQPIPVSEDERITLRSEELSERLEQSAKSAYHRICQSFGDELMSRLERFATLQTIDDRWKEHLYEMDRLKEGIGLRAYGQKDPLLEYKHEAFRTFTDLMIRIDHEILRFIFRAPFQMQGAPAMETHEQPTPARMAAVHAEATGMAFAKQSVSDQEGNAPQAGRHQPVHKEPKVGRNDPCPCGSGKKYKHCHGKLS